MKHIVLIGLAAVLACGCGPSDTPSVDNTEPNAEATVAVDLSETFELVGHIGTQNNGVGNAAIGAWRDAYKTRPELVHAPPRPSRDPATGKSVPLEMPLEERAVKRGNEWIALFGWNSMSDDSNETGIVTVRVSPNANIEMIEFAKELAEEMGSRFVAVK